MPRLEGPTDPTDPAGVWRGRVRKAAEDVVISLFTSREGEAVHRLVLLDDDTQTTKGDWTQEAVRRRVLAVMTRVLRVQPSRPKEP